ncbi:MAG TPA: phosphatase PAP2 family protein [Nocardioidaceae bacterium]|nr:phosphatase PAP2 family protein [Nocardioidaceae bacterium]
MGVALMTGALAVIASQSLGLPIRDPDGFLGPAWIRLPLLVLGAFLADVVPRSAWRSRGNLSQFRNEARTIVREHWTRERMTLVVIGLVSFYVTYVGYRNLKNFLPFIREGTLDPVLKNIDEAIFFGGDPAIFLHTVLGEGVSAHVLSYVYLIFLPFVPISVTAWLVWSRNISFGYWYVTSQCLAWALGTASYYAVPSLGPAFYYVWLYSGLENTGVTQLQDALSYGRSEVLFDPFNADGVQSVAGFASLHVAITLLAALVAHYTVRHAWIRWGLWIYVGITLIATIYFGWHYISDDIAGAFIAVVSVYLGGLATGQKFDRHGLASHPTTSTADIPVEEASVAR